MGQRVRRLGSWLASHPVDVVFTVLVAVAFGYSLRITRESFFSVDDWLLIKQAGSLGGLFDAYNQHLSFNILVIYGALARVFGFHYTPYRVVGLLGFVAVPAAYYLTVRRQLGAALTALLALPLLWFGRYVSLFPGEVNHNLALIGAIGCAAALNRGRRADWILAASLAFALLSAGGAVAVVAACLVHNLCVRPPLRRWLAVVLPAAAWTVWWLVKVGETNDLGPFAFSTSQTIEFVRDLAYTPFQSAALGSSVVAVVLVLAFVAYGVWTLTKGLVAGANYLAWSVALVVWALGLANSRGVLADVVTFRYRYVALAFVLLAVVPRKPIVWPERFPINVDRRWAYAAAAVILVAGAARGLAVRTDMQDFAERNAASGRSNRATALTVGLGPTIVPGATDLGFSFGNLEAGQVRTLLDRYGNPFGVTRATADRALLDIVARPASDGPRDVRCTPRREPFLASVKAPPQVILWAPDSSFRVDVRRFGDTWVPVTTARAGEAVRFQLPTLRSAVPWEIRADGACRVGPRRG